MSTIFRCCQKNQKNDPEFLEGLIEIGKDINTFDIVDHLEYKSDRGYPIFGDNGKMKIGLMI